MELTKQEFEQVLDKRFIDFGEAVDKKFVDFGQEMDKKLDEKLDTKLAAQTKELKAYADEQTEHLALIIAETVAIPLQQLKVRFEQHIADPYAHSRLMVYEKPKRKYKA